ncbi:hypothetical protein JST56_07155 [Candidatus Dependentiae bacterium]|nr:hypothetical protein [Candidatus Dependentiae bacterium]
MATSTRKKNTVPEKPKPREYHNASFDLTHFINKVASGKALTDITDEDFDETYEEAIKRLINEMDDFYKAAWDAKDDAELKNGELEKDLESLSADVERLDAYTAGISDISTMVGELKFETDNLLDAHTMELVTELMQKVPPVKLIEILQNTLKGIDLL